MKAARRTDPTAALIPRPGQPTLLDYVPAGRTDIAARFALERARLRALHPIITELHPAPNATPAAGTVRAFSPAARRRQP